MVSIPEKMHEVPRNMGVDLQFKVENKNDKGK